MKNQNENIEVAIPIAAAVAERAAEFIGDGHVKGLLSSGYKGVQHFCANGAISLALQEVFGECDVNHINGLTGLACTSGEQAQAKAVYDLLVMYAKQEAEIRFGFVPTGLEANNVSSFNDRETTSQEDVITILRATAERLWDLMPEAPTEPQRSWAEADAEPEAQRQYVTS